MLLVTAYQRMNLTLRQLALPVGISKSAADLSVHDRGPGLALQPRELFRKDLSRRDRQNDRTPS